MSIKNLLWALILLLPHAQASSFPGEQVYDAEADRKAEENYLECIQNNDVDCTELLSDIPQELLNSEILDVIEMDIFRGLYEPHRF